MAREECESARIDHTAIVRAGIGLHSHSRDSPPWRVKIDPASVQRGHENAALHRGAMNEETLGTDKLWAQSIIPGGA